jgi:hypothetical protein
MRLSGKGTSSRMLGRTRSLTEDSRHCECRPVAVAAPAALTARTWAASGSGRSAGGTAAAHCASTGASRASVLGSRPVAIKLQRGMAEVHAQRVAQLAGPGAESPG